MGSRAYRRAAKRQQPQRAEPVAVTAPVVVAAPEPTPAAPAERLAEMAAKKRRTFSIKGLADFLQVDRSVIDKDINKNGFVPDRMGGKGTGNEYEIDVAKYHAWKMEHVRKAVTAELGGTSDGDVEEDSKLLKLFKEASLVMLVADIKARDTRLLGELAQTIMSVSDQVSRSMTGMPRDKINGWCDHVDRIHREALAKLHTSFDESYVEPSVFVSVED